MISPDPQAAAFWRQLTLEFEEEPLPDKHSGLPVAGYQAQPQFAVDLVNEAKHLEELCLRFFDGLEKMATRKVLQTVPVVDDRVVVKDVIEPTGKIDQRFLAMARSHLQIAFMLANRSVFQPQRIDLPPEFDFEHLSFK